MEELNKKVVGNAVSAYFMVFVSIFFLFSKNKYINHPFVKSHVKSAFSLHVLMALVLFVMSYPFLESTHISDFSLNRIITSALSLCIFSGILYGMYMAHKGKTVTLGEMFRKAGSNKNYISTSKSEKVSEEASLDLILAHIPFFGYMIAPRHQNLAHMRDISQLNFVTTLISSLIFIAGYTSLASLIMLMYIIYCVFQAIRLTLQDEIATLNLDIIPTVGEKYILQKSLLSYLWNKIHKKSFTPLKQIIQHNTLLAQSREKEDESKIMGKHSFHIRHSIVLVLLYMIMVFIFSWDSRVLILFLFPLCYSIGYAPRRTYRMPYIYDLYAFFAHLLSSIGRIFKKTRKLQKTQINETIKMGPTQADMNPSDLRPASFTKGSPKEDVSSDL